MTPERRDFWISAFYTMGQVWHFLEGTPDRIRVWDAALQDLSVASLERGVAWLIGHAADRQTPVPGALRAAVKEWRIAQPQGEAPKPLLLPPSFDKLPRLEEGSAQAARSNGQGKGVLPPHRRLERDA